MTTTDQLEHVAFSMWKAEAMRAAPNVGKHRTPEDFANALPAERAKWLDLARAAIAAMQGENGLSDMPKPQTPTLLPHDEFALVRTQGEWLGPIPHDSKHKPTWLSDSAIVMVAFNPRKYQVAMTWEFAEKRKAPAKDRDWEAVTAFCVELPIRPSTAPKDTHHDA